jgi:hypothetical protein
MATRRAFDRLRFRELFDHKIAFARDRVFAQPGASHFTDTLCDARFPLHEHVSIVRKGVCLQTKTTDGIGLLPGR